MDVFKVVVGIIEKIVLGVADRLDRCQLLGNGVNPDTAELAFITLLEKINV